MSGVAVDTTGVDVRQNLMILDQTVFEIYDCLFVTDERRHRRTQAIA